MRKQGVQEIKLIIKGKERKFTEEELTSIVEKHFSRVSHKKYELALEPIEKKAFRVVPLEINRALFAKEREEKQQERTREKIVEAFEELDRCPEQYARPFRTIRPNMREEPLTANDFRNEANEIGDHLANWVEQALEWAQRLTNGESWEKLCNDPDVTECYRMIEWKDGFTRLIGGSTKCNTRYPATDIHGNVSIYYYNSKYKYVVPLVVDYQ